MDPLTLIENRVAKLENLVGKFEKIEDTKGLESLTNVSNRVNSYISNSPKISLSLKNLNLIKKYLNMESINEVEEEALINSKIDFILSEEPFIRSLSEDFTKLDELVKILDNKSLNDVENLTEKLKELSAKQASQKTKQEGFKDDLKVFLTVYANSINSINETITCLKDYVDQFDSPVPKRESIEE